MELTSREYKLTLFKDGFVGSEMTCRAAVADFWSDMIERLAEKGVTAFGKLNQADPDKQRELFFLDTDEKALYRQADLVFRLRRALGAKADWDATLKFRHGDRLLAGGQAFRGAKRVKFEEDVKLMPPKETPRFWALFSRSAPAKFADADTMARVGDCLAPYEKLPKKALRLADATVSRVRGWTIREHVFEGGYIELDEDRDAECALILWWKSDEPEAPVAAEFSFRFDLDTKGEADGKIVRTAWKAMTALVMSSWVDPDGKTKTALVYGDAEI